MIDVDRMMQEFCRSGAQAVYRYVEVSGEAPLTMPEFFMPAFIFNAMGSKITMTLETSFSALTEWNSSVRDRRGLPKKNHDDRLLRLAGQLNGRRVDCVLFEGEEEGRSKDQQDFLALVEFKKGWIDALKISGKISDRDKLLMLLAHVDTCRWGIVCGCFHKVQRDWQKGEGMQGTADRWYECETQLPSQESEPYCFGARLFERSSDDARVEELIDEYGKAINSH